MDWQLYATQLLEEFEQCMQAKPRHDAVGVQLEKDSCARFAYHLNTQRAWGSENEIAEACYQLEPRLKKLKEKLVMEILKDGTV